MERSPSRDPRECRRLGISLESRPRSKRKRELCFGFFGKEKTAIGGSPSASKRRDEDEDERGRLAAKRGKGPQLPFGGSESIEPLELRGAISVNRQGRRSTRQRDRPRFAALSSARSRAHKSPFRRDGRNMPASTKVIGARRSDETFVDRISRAPLRDSHNLHKWKLLAIAAR